MAWQLDFARYPADGFVATEGCVELESRVEISQTA